MNININHVNDIKVGEWVLFSNKVVAKCNYIHINTVTNTPSDIYFDRPICKNVETGGDLFVSTYCCHDKHAEDNKDVTITKIYKDGETPIIAGEVYYDKCTYSKVYCHGYSKVDITDVVLECLDEPTGPGSTYTQNPDCLAFWNEDKGTK